LALSTSCRLAFVQRLVQYCVNTCSAVDAAQRKAPLFRRKVAGERDRDFYKKRPAQTRDINPLAGQVLREMIASGWQTAPPQMNDSEVVLVTNSACPQLLEASPRVRDLPGIAFSASCWGAHSAELLDSLAPVIDFSSRASASRNLSAPR
jgi:hypothetical protein